MDSVDSTAGSTDKNSALTVNTVTLYGTLVLVLFYNCISAENFVLLIMSVMHCIFMLVKMLAGS